MQIQQVISINGQPVGSVDQRSLRMTVLYHSECNFILNNLIRWSVQKPASTRLSNNSSSKRSTRSRQTRWYAGFHCQGNVQETLDIIAQKIQEFRLNNVVRLIHIANRNKRSSEDFYLFVAIDINKPGEFPGELSNLPCFSHPIEKARYFTRDQVILMFGRVQKIQFVKRRPTRSTQKIDPFANCEILEQDHSSNPNLTKLLDWLSARGYSSWATFQSVCQSLAIQDPNRVVRNLKLLGHLEISPNGKKWSIAPTGLVSLNDQPENLEFYLCGQQNAYLRQQLEQFAEVKAEGQPVSFGLPRWKVTFSDRPTYNRLEKLGEIPIHKAGNIALRLAKCLPTLQEWQATLAVVGGIVPSQRHWRQYQPATQDFQDCGLPEKTGFYEMRSEADQPYPDRTLFYDANTQTWRQGDWYGLRFLTLHYSEKLRECCYRPAQKQLVILCNERWPQLYERSLVLASGYLPQVISNSSDRVWLCYHNITSDLASSLTHQLSLTCQGL